MWEFMKRAKVTFIIGGVILLVAAVSIIYAVATREGDEGFIAQWKRSNLPATCTYDPNELNGDDVQRLHDTVAYFAATSGNYISGCQPWMLKEHIPSKPPVGGIIVRIGKPVRMEEDGTTLVTPFDPVHGGSTVLYHLQDGSIGGAVIWIMKDIPEGLEEAVWRHEFGHALGLAHDRTKDSLMYPVAGKRRKELSSKDTKLLQEAYGNE